MSKISDMLAATRKWQSIETAPKDGTRVMLWRGFADIGDWSEMVIAEWHDGAWPGLIRAKTLALTENGPITNLLRDMRTVETQPTGCHCRHHQGRPDQRVKLAVSHRSSARKWQPRA